MIGVIDTEDTRAAWTFPADPGVVRRARGLVRDQLAEWELGGVGDVTVLLVSELVTNSLRYASGPIVLCLVRTSDALLVEVSDPLPDLPCERVAGHEDESGRGIQLVARSARRWGTRTTSCGKTVWFELALPG
ncbi:ATP-binding protein [Streptomyces tsukubensis]|uniref:Histidine kinase/HSP90-like ATPase domain-containing protein n=1 Tax=Streptomyces tsukubensis TaxID=83656 RepID=A0A1V4AD28_9ACTN|nr:ATP-binding protein [Streptomyces tsukubensis]OON81343.1 hypothetical protein B1H18_08355 [Streptomyces tsukubensis]QFR95539.1 ATP-binding protein [Streptomyces tsukubensis]